MQARVEGRRKTWICGHPLARGVLALGALLLFMAPRPAQATLIGQTVTVTLTGVAAPVPVLVGSGPEVTPADGSTLGAVLLPTERVDVGAEAIDLTLEEGAPGGSTGLPPGSLYVFSNLVFSDVVTRIVAVGLGLHNISNLALGDVTFTDDSVSIPVSALVIGEIPGVNNGTIHLALEFSIVPEPGTLGLVGSGLGVLAAARRRARRES